MPYNHLLSVVQTTLENTPRSQNHIENIQILVVSIMCPLNVVNNTLLET